VATETEIKLRVSNRDAVQARIQSLGYSVRTPRELEADQLYDRADGKLYQSGQTLRVRTRGTRSTVTYKGPVQPGPHKSREEIELDVSDGSAFAVVLNKLGYQPNFRYEKYRTTFAADKESGIITYDETPAGDFLELEGFASWIDSTARNLGYSAADYITESYASIWLKHCKNRPKTVPSAMTF
jgi:predicted adenylyl cyclase CyaB